MHRLNVLLSAYCCEPDRGSEPGVGWNIALGLAKHHDVWVLTRAANRKAIEAALPAEPPLGLHFVYYDLPRWSRWWKRGMRGLQLYYYLWQIGGAYRARSLNRTIRFDVAHHLTLGRYWTPSFLWALGVPFIWGPVGGGEAAPRSYLRSYGPRGWLYEHLRSTAQALALLDPFLRLTARRSHTALVATRDTECRIRHLGATSIQRVHGQTGVSDEELTALDTVEPEPGAPFRVLTLGRLLHWKGAHLGLLAFARANVPEAEYWIVGDGPEEKRLRRLAERIAIRDRVVFWGHLPRDQALTLLRKCDVLVHASVHDFSPTVVFEALAARKPVLCLELGGPASQVTPECGVLVPAANPGEAVAGLARAMRRLQADPDLRRRLGAAGRERVAALFTWEHKIRQFLELYAAAVPARAAHPAHGSLAARPGFLGVENAP